MFEKKDIGTLDTEGKSVLRDAAVQPISKSKQYPYNNSAFPVNKAEN